MEDQFQKETDAPWKNGQMIEFGLKPWTKANSPGQLAKRPPSGGSNGSTGTHDTAPPPSQNDQPDAPGSGDASSGASRTGYQSQTRPVGRQNLAITVLLEEETRQFKTSPKTDDT
jgi:hypothetical protein